MNTDDFEYEISRKNPIINRAKVGIEWIRNVDTHKPKFDGISFTPAPGIYSIKWINHFDTRTTLPPYNNHIVYHDFEIEITLNKSPDGLDRNFQADLDTIYAAEWALKVEFKICLGSYNYKF